jgi:hypothetical protein
MVSSSLPGSMKSSSPDFKVPLLVVVYPPQLKSHTARENFATIAGAATDTEE